MLGLQTALSVVIETMVEPGLLDWRAWPTGCRSARGIGGLTDHGRPIAAGEPANLVLVDPAARDVVDPAGLASQPQHAVRRPGPARSGGRDLPARQPTVLDGKAVR